MHLCRFSIQQKTLGIHFCVLYGAAAKNSCEISGRLVSCWREARSLPKACHGMIAYHRVREPLDDVTNTRTGFEPAMESVMDQVEHGHDVEITYSYSSSGKTYRHRAMIAKVEQFHREDGWSWYRIWTIDDNNQRDDKAANDLNCLIVNEVGVIYEQAGDGSWIRYGKVDQFSFDQYIPRLTDVNDDGKVDGADLAPVLGGFSGTPDGSEDDCDFNGDGETDGVDLAIILGYWGMTFER